MSEVLFGGFDIGGLEILGQREVGGGKQLVELMPGGEALDEADEPGEPVEEGLGHLGGRDALVLDYV